jgi:hypothetical protein
MFALNRATPRALRPPNVAVNINANLIGEANVPSPSPSPSRTRPKKEAPVSERLSPKFKFQSLLTAEPASLAAAQALVPVQASALVSVPEPELAQSLAQPSH